MPYMIQVTDVTENAVDVAAADEPSLRVIRDEVKLHGYQVGEVQAVLDAFRFRATSDDPGKVREFLMGLTDVDVSA